MTARRVLILNGPNLGRLGLREPGVYGSTGYAELAEQLVRHGAELGLAVEVRQTDAEHELLHWLYEAFDAATPVVLNAGAWTHDSHALGDAVAMRTAELIEVHISNVHAREEFRHRSVISAHASGIIVGFGVSGYRLALRSLADGGTVPA